MQVEADIACNFLPEYLNDEVEQHAGQETNDSFHEFQPSILFMDQMIRMAPRQYSVRLQMMPAWEETLMRWQEDHDSKNSDQ